MFYFIAELSIMYLFLVTTHRLCLQEFATSQAMGSCIISQL